MLGCNLSPELLERAKTRKNSRSNALYIYATQ